MNTHVSNVTHESAKNVSHYCTIHKVSVWFGDYLLNMLLNKCDNVKLTDIRSLYIAFRS